MSHPDALQDYGDTEQAQDEQRAFMRAVELAQRAERLGFTQQEMEDLIYHLGIKEYFRKDDK